MSFRFFRRIRLAPGLTFNLSKSGGSLSFGPRGAKLTAGTRGVRRTVSLPGTGLFYTERVGTGGKKRGGSKRARSRQTRSASKSDDGRVARAPALRPEDRLSLGFFRRLFTPEHERHFVDGMRQVVLGNEIKALDYLRQAPHLADAAFMAGMIALKRERLDEAIGHLTAARRKHATLNRHFEKYGVCADVTLPIAERISAVVGPDIRGVLLALAEAHQAADRPMDALRDLQALQKRDPDDPVLILSICEILVEEFGSKSALRQVVKLSAHVDNETYVHAAILLWKGKALRRLGFHTAARDTLTAAFRRKKDRPDDLLLAIRYERALVYDDLGEEKRARQELEKLYADAPDYEDVARRLGLSGDSDRALTGFAARPMLTDKGNR